MTEKEFTGRVRAITDRLWRISYAILRCGADCDDALQEAFPKTPAHFVNRMNSVLSEIENEKPQRVKGRRPAALLAAAIVILALTGSTVAVGSAMGVDIKAFDKNGTRYAENDSSFDLYERADGTTVYRQIQEIQTSEKMPESIVFKPKVIGADKWLDAIECKIE